MTDAQRLATVMRSFPLYTLNFMKIANKEGREVPFLLNPQQKELFTTLPKFSIVLKSRQLGISSAACAYAIYTAIIKPNSACLLVSYSNDSATAIFDKLKQLYNSIPAVLKPDLIANNRKELKFTNGSKITCATAGTKEISRGATLSYVHLSELAFWKENVVQKQLIAIEQALTPNGKLCIESTANGLNSFSELYNRATNGENLYTPYFFGWIDDKLMFSQEYKLYTEKYLATHDHLPEENELDEIERDYYRIGATIEQLVWRRIKIKNTSVEAFQQEFPTTPTEAFITTGSNIFNSEMIHRYLLAVANQKPLAEAASLPEELQPHFNRSYKVWEEPQPFAKYYIGVDCAEGLGGINDYNALIVLDKDLKQVAQFHSNTIKPYQFAEIVNAVGHHYNKALLVVEKASAGSAVLEKLYNDFKYRNIYKHKEFDQRGKIIKKIGFVTSAKSKPILINDTVEYFENGDVFIQSKELLEEMKLYTYSEGKMNAARGTHDDLVIALCLAIHGFKEGINYAA